MELANRFNQSKPDSIDLSPVKKAFAGMTADGSQWLYVRLSYDPADPYYIGMTFLEAASDGKDILWECPRQELAKPSSPQEQDPDRIFLKNTVAAERVIGESGATYTKIMLIGDDPSEPPFSFVLSADSLDAYIAQTEERVPFGKESAYQFAALSTAIVQLEAHMNQEALKFKGPTN